MPSRPKAIPIVHIDNQKTIVTEWKFPVGAETGWHRHAYDYLVVPLTSGNLVMETRTEVKKAELSAGIPYFRQLGMEHNVVNDNEHEFVFIETEFK